MTNTPATDRLRETLKSKEGQETLIAWLSSPFTQDMLAAGREMARPARPEGATDTFVSLALGETIGGNKILDFMSQPHIVLTRPTGAGLPQPDYGARRTLRKERENGQ